MEVRQRDSQIVIESTRKLVCDSDWLRRDTEYDNGLTIDIVNACRVSEDKGLGVLGCWGEGVIKRANLQQLQWRPFIARFIIANIL